MRTFKIKHNNHRQSKTDIGNNQMKKSVIIANCLVNSGFFDTINLAELAVEKIFFDESKEGEYSDWNANVTDSYGKNLIKNVGRASKINVSKFIDDLK